MPRPRRFQGGPEPSDTWITFGMQIMGWAESFAGTQDRPVSACFKFALPFDEDDEECDQTYSEPTTQFIRTETVYGVCGATYQKHQESRQNIRQPDGFSPNLVITPAACTITQ